MIPAAYAGIGLIPEPCQCPRCRKEPPADDDPAIVDGKLVRLSPSSITTGDARAEGGCLRKWWFEYPGGRRPPTTAAQGAGTDTHNEIEHYLLTGERVLGPLALSGAHLIPKPGPGLLVERALDRKALTCAGVRVGGYVDLTSFRGEVVGAPEFLPPDPDGTVEIRDWKTTKSIASYAKTPDELRRNVQMVTYGIEALRVWDPPAVRLSHAYFQTGKRAPGVLRTVLVRPEELLAEWEQVEAVGRRIIAAALATDPDDVTPNTRACNAYRGCPHRAYCSAGSHDSLRDMFGDEHAQTIITRLEERDTMGLADKLNPNVAPVADKATLLAQLAQTEATETARQAAAAVPPGFAEAFAKIDRAVHNGGPLGRPPIAGEVAKIYAVMIGVRLEGQGFAGSGPAGKVPTIFEVAKLFEFVRQLEAAGKILPPPVVDPLAALDAPETPPIQVDTAPPVHPAATGENPILPPDVPASDPKLAAMPVEGVAVPAAVAEVVAAMQTPEVAAATAAALEATPAETGAAAVAGAKRRGRPPGSGKGKTKIDGGTNAAALVEAKGGTPALEVYVNALPSVEFTSLDNYIEAITGALCKTHGVIDVRVAPNDSPLAFGKWKGAIAVWARSNPPPPDTYVVIAPDEIAEVVVDALRPVADLYVQGVR